MVWDDDQALRPVWVDELMVTASYPVQHKTGPFDRLYHFA
jgi:hypothetical protein